MMKNRSRGYVFVLKVGPLLHTLFLPVQLFFLDFDDKSLQIDFRELPENFKICHQESFHINFPVFEMDELIFFLWKRVHFSASELRFFDFGWI